MTTTLIKAPRFSLRAFTLVELMVSVTVSSIILTSIFSTFIVFAKSAVSVGDYAEMSRESRKALEVFSRDIRAAESLEVSNAQSTDNIVYTESGIDLAYPAYYGTRQVRYRYRSEAAELVRVETYNGTTSRDVLLSGVRQLKLEFYQTPGSDFAAVSGPVASVDLWTKSVQLDAELLRKVVTTENTDYIISARFMMRN